MQSSGRHGGGGYRPGGYTGESRIPMRRYPVTATAGVVNWMEARVFQRDFRDAYDMQPCCKFARKAMSPAFPPRDVASTFPTRFAWRAVNRPLTAVNCLTFMPGGHRVLTGCQNGVFSMWNAEYFIHDSNHKGHDDTIRDMAWSHDEQWLISADVSGVVRSWRPNLKLMKDVARHEQGVTCLDWAPTNLKFVTACDDAVLRVWDFAAAAVEVDLKGHNWDVRCCAWHPRKGLIASGSKDCMVKLWDPRGGECVSSLHGHKHAVLVAEWNKNGNWLLTTSKDKTIKLFDIRKLAEVHTYTGHDCVVTCASWHPHEESVFVAGGYDGSMTCFTADIPEAKGRVPNAHQDAIWDVKWHPAGHLLASGSKDRATKFWARSIAGDTFRNIYVGQSRPEEPADDQLLLDGITEASAAKGVAGLPPNHHNTDALDGVDGLRDAHAFSRNISSAADAAAATRTREFTSVPPSTYVCHACNKPGHWIQACPEKRRPGGTSSGGDRQHSSVPPPTYVCHACNQPGHWIFDCPSKRPRDRNAVPPSNYVCRICRKPGHYITNCPESGGGSSSGRSSRHDRPPPSPLDRRSAPRKRRWDD